MSDWYRLAVGVLVTWRVTHLLYAEDGPWLLFARFRHAVSRVGVLRQMIECFYCLSLWVAGPFAYLLGAGWTERALLVPAFSAGSILLDRVVNPQPPMPHYIEDQTISLSLRRGLPATSSHQKVP